MVGGLAAAAPRNDCVLQGNGAHTCVCVCWAGVVSAWTDKRSCALAGGACIHVCVDRVRAPHALPTCRQTGGGSACTTGMQGEAAHASMLACTDASAPCAFTPQARRVGAATGVPARCGRRHQGRRRCAAAAAAPTAQKRARRGPGGGARAVGCEQGSREEVGTRKAAAAAHGGGRTHSSRWCRQGAASGEEAPR
eukprot:353200-Chlamydomonas_euryale.AAC.1